MDAWSLKHTGNAYDKDGEWALSGKCNETLLQTLLADPYFKTTTPQKHGP